MISSRIILFAVLALALASENSALCQTMYVGLDSSWPSHDVRYDGDETDRPVTDLSAISVGWYSNSFRRDDSETRYGFVVRRGGIKTESSGIDRTWVKYKSTTLQASYDRKLFKGGLVFLSGGVHFGATFVTDEHEYGETCNEMFCVAPNGSLSLFPELRATAQLDFSVTAYAAVRGQLYSDTAEKDFLFKRGYVFSVGLCVQ